MRALTEAIHAIEHSRRGGASERMLDLRWARPRLVLDRPFPREHQRSADRLGWSCVHECIASDGDNHAPLLLLVHIAHRVLTAPISAEAGATPSSAPIVWIGKRVFPSPVACADLVNRSVWIDPPDTPSRLWAIDLALRSKGVAAVIADGSGMDMAASRRLQLAAEAGGTIGIFWRPARERAILTAAATRWLVTPSPTPPIPHTRPRWTVELLRCKGVQPDPEAPRRFVVEWNHAQGALVVPSELAGGPDAAAGPIPIPVPLPIRAAG